MSLLNWIWDIDQDGKIRDQRVQIEELNRDVELLKQWVEYLNRELESIRAGTIHDI
jgi:hypothetical protein